MANTKSSKKDILRSAKRKTANTATKSALKTHIKKVRTTATSGDGTAADNLKAAVSAIDKAVQRGIIHKNQAARRKSRIAKLVTGTSAAAKPKAEKAEAAPKAEAKPKAATKTAAKPKAAAKKPAAKPAAKKKSG